METVSRTETIVRIAENNTTTVILNDTDMPSLTMGSREVELVDQSSQPKIIINSPGFGTASPVPSGFGNSYYPGGWA